MGTISDKLARLSDTKKQLRYILEQMKLINLDEDVPFSEYANRLHNNLLSNPKYNRPNDWLPEPSFYTDKDEVNILFAVYENQENPIAFSIKTLDGSPYTVDWGDGLTEQLSCEAVAEHLYSFTGCPESSLCSRGYRQVWLKVSAPGRILEADFQKKVSGKSYGESNILQFRFKAPRSTKLVLGKFAGIYHSLMEKAEVFFIDLTSLSYLFANCEKLQCYFLSDTSNVTYMGGMFYNCSSLTSIPELDTSNVTDMGSMFSYCSSLTTIPNLDSSNATDMRYMFDGCSNITTIPELNTSNVTDMGGMFRGCSCITTIPELDTSNVTDMDSMFSSCSSLTTIPELDTSNVTDMGSMFSYCSSLTTIPNLDSSNVTYMGGMFYNCFSLTTIPELDTSKVTNTSSMFSGCRSLTTIPNLDTSNVTNTNSMFSSCSSLTTIPKLDTSNVTDMDSMFSSCSSLTTIPNLDSSNVTYMGGMFFECYQLIYLTLINPSISFDLSYSPIGYSVFISNILTNLATINTNETIMIRSFLMDSLSEDDIAIATNKGWTLVTN